MSTVGDIDYRNGSKERLSESFILLRKGLFAGSVYLAGRAVEGMLRAVVWKSDPEYSHGERAWKPAITSERCYGSFETSAS